MKKLLLGAGIIALTIATSLVFADDQSGQMQPQQQDQTRSGQLQATQPNNPSPDPTTQVVPANGSNAGQTMPNQNGTTQQQPTTDANQAQPAKTDTSGY